LISPALAFAARARSTTITCAQIKAASAPLLASGVLSSADKPMAQVSDGAHLDAMHAGDIRGALGTIVRNDTASRKGLCGPLHRFWFVVLRALVVAVALLVFHVAQIARHQV
jgi:hypothetical protein